MSFVCFIGSSVGVLHFLLLLCVPAKAQQQVNVNIHVCKVLCMVDKSGTRRVPMGLHSVDIGDVKHYMSLQAETPGIIKS